MMRQPSIARLLCFSHQFRMVRICSHDVVAQLLRSPRDEKAVADTAGGWIIGPNEAMGVTSRSYPLARLRTGREDPAWHQALTAIQKLQNPRGISDDKTLRYNNGTTMERQWYNNGTTMVQHVRPIGNVESSGIDVVNLYI